MKFNIRKSVFETNSSSTHSLCIVSKEEYEKYKKGELIFDKYEDELVKLTEKIKKNMLLEEEGGEDKCDEDYEEGNYETYEDLGGDMYETFEENHKTKGGDEIVAFGYHGYGG